MKKGICLWLLLCLCLSTGAFGCANSQPKSAVYYTYFDTVATVRCYAGDGEEDFDRRCGLVEDALKRYHRLFDIYHEYAGLVNLATVNASAALAPVAVDGELFAFLTYAKEVYALTEGKTNAAMGALLSLWHDCREAQTPTLPALADLQAAAEHVSMDDLILDAEASTVYFADPLLTLDVGALGKGYAVEKAADVLAADGAEGYLLDVGGNLRAVGQKSESDPFSVGVYHPLHTDGSYAALVSLANASCVTSGSYQRYVEIDGVRYAHVIDPDTLYPAAYFLSVTVVTEDSGRADALSTALFCMEEDEGNRLAEAIGGIRIIRILNDGTVTDVSYPPRA